MKQITTIIFILLSLTIFAQTPNWQWIKAGGANTSLHQSNMNYRTKQIGTDAQGNVYGIASVSSAGIAIDTLIAVNGYGYDDFVVFSYSCEGDFRWMKMFGSYNDDIPGGIIVDKEGDVFISGGVYVTPYGDAHFGDSVIVASNNYFKGYFISKFDNQGNIVYLNFPGPAIANVGATPIRMEADNQGNPVILTWFSDSTTWNGHHVNRRGYYLVKFDKIDGNLTDIAEMGFNTPYNNSAHYESTFLNLDNNNDIYLFVTVRDSIFIGNDTIIADQWNLDSMHYILAKFDINGFHIWHTVVTAYSGYANYQSIWGKPIIYGNNVYMEAHTRSDTASKFMGVPIYNPTAWITPVVTSLFASFDKNTGAFKSVINLWSKYGITDTPINIQNNSLVAAVASPLILLGANDTIKPYYSGSQNFGYPAIVSMDTGLTHFNWGIATKTVLPNVGWSVSSCLYVDHNNNIILGGGLTGPITNTAGDTTNLVAAKENFCIAKIALSNDSCGCAKAIPKIAIVSSSGNTLIVKGSATNQPDSLYIIWGDGDSTFYNNSNSNISHTYANTGPWNICLRAYGFCGVEDSCLTNLYSGVYPQEQDNEINISIYPNPFNDRINIVMTNSINQSDLIIYDMVGRLVYSTSFSGKRISIDLKELKKGMYFVKLITDKGKIDISKIVKN